MSLFCSSFSILLQKPLSLRHEGRVFRILPDQRLQELLESCFIFVFINENIKQETAGIVFVPIGRGGISPPILYDELQPPVSLCSEIIPNTLPSIPAVKLKKFSVFPDTQGEVAIGWFANAVVSSASGHFARGKYQHLIPLPEGDFRGSPWVPARINLHSPIVLDVESRIVGWQFQRVFAPKAE
jgi:hypothetical protein